MIPDFPAMQNANRNLIVTVGSSYRYATGGGTRLRKTRILVVNSPPLAQVIRYILRDRPEFEVADVGGTLRGMARMAKDLSPDVVVASVKPVKADMCGLVSYNRRSSPRTGIILACPHREFNETAAKCGSDQSMEQERLVLRLAPAIQALAGRRPRPVASMHRRLHSPSLSCGSKSFIRSAE